MITFEDITGLSPAEFWTQEIRPGHFESESATGICEEIFNNDFYECDDLDFLGEQGWMDICVPALVAEGVARGGSA